MLITALQTLVLILSPYSGPALPGSSPATAKFLVTISGTSGQTVRLRAVGVPKSYIASFCTNRVCAPSHVSFALPQSGRERIELQLIENQSGAQRPKTVTVAGNGGARASIAFSRATH